MRTTVRFIVFLGVASTLPAIIAVGCSGGTQGESGAAGAQTSQSAAGGAGGTGGTGETGGAGGSTGGMGGSTSSSAGGAPTAVAPCGGKIYECGDLDDNDGDGTSDSFDVDCLGPCDNSEDSYYPDLPGMTGADCKVDCFWDNGNGSGNDDCYWDHYCDKLEVGPDYPPEQGCAYNPDKAKTAGFTCDEAFTMQSQFCLDFCSPLTPNGCDCFGCCELPAGSGKFVWLASYDDQGLGTCTLDVVEDTSKCKPCTFVPGCGNPCGKCEVCIGKPEPDPSCYPDGGSGGTGGEGGSGGGTGQCPAGVQPCGLPGQAACPANYYCITGCCQSVPG